MSTFYDDSIDEQAKEQIFKIIIIGDSNVGKTCLAYRFCTGRFPERTEATIGVDFCEKRLVIDDETLRLQIWDTAGQERFRKSMVGHYYRNVSAVVFMYDITRKSSFEALGMWLDEYGNYAYGGNVPKIIIGNKCDLGKERTVNSNDARKFADFHSMPLWEISTKNDNELATIESIFLTLAHKLIKQKPMMEPVNDHFSREKSGSRRKTHVPGNIYEVDEKYKKTIKLKKQGSLREKKCCSNGS